VGEVGGFSVTARGRRIYLLQTAEKGMAWMRLTARGTAGHGSMIQSDNAVTKLTAALHRIGSYDWPVRLTPAMVALLATVSELSGQDVTPDSAPHLVAEFGGAARMLGAGLRHTANPTMLAAGYKVNVVPAEAVGHVDGRFLPGYEQEFIDTIKELCGDQVTGEFLVREPAWEMPHERPIVAAMATALTTADPDALVSPYLMSGGTDAKSFTRLGITSYGFTPLRLPEDLDFTALFHGVDERVPVDALAFGARVFDTFLNMA
jgi:acetylornithine deacetylase/succinyl-diaminopimelate desuccinylase-like protein